MPATEGDEVIAIARSNSAARGASLFPAANLLQPLSINRLGPLTMAQRNYLVEGLSGTGKSSVYEELTRRGYWAISTDRAWAYNADPDTGLPGGPVRHDTWVWDRQKAVSELGRPEPEVLFVCGSGRNRDHFLAYFSKIFNLHIDDATMRRRLQARTADDWDLGAEATDLMLELNRSNEKPTGAIDIDATQPLNDVVDELLRLAESHDGA
jgi:hypothetical protein